MSSDSTGGAARRAQASWKSSSSATTAATPRAPSRRRLAARRQAPALVPGRQHHPSATDEQAHEGFPQRRERGFGFSTGGQRAPPEDHSLRADVVGTSELVCDPHNVVPNASVDGRVRRGSWSVRGAEWLERGDRPVEIAAPPGTARRQGGRQPVCPPGRSIDEPA